MKKGDIVLIPFPFTDLTGSKLRPAVVLAATDMDVTLVFITTQQKWKEQFDVVLTPNSSNGLKLISIIRLSKIPTLDKELIQGKLGSLTESQVLELNSKLIEIFKLVTKE